MPMPSASEASQSRNPRHPLPANILFGAHCSSPRISLIRPPPPLIRPLRRAAGERKGTCAKRGGGEVVIRPLLTHIADAAGTHLSSPRCARVPSSPPTAWAERTQEGGEDVPARGSPPESAGVHFRVDRMNADGIGILGPESTNPPTRHPRKNTTSLAPGTQRQTLVIIRGLYAASRPGPITGIGSGPLLGNRPLKQGANAHNGFRAETLPTGLGGRPKPARQRSRGQT